MTRLLTRGCDMADKSRYPLRGMALPLAGMQTKTGNHHCMSSTTGRSRLDQSGRQTALAYVAFWGVHTERQKSNAAIWDCSRCTQHGVKEDSPQLDLQAAGTGGHSSYLLSLFRYLPAGHSRIHTHTSKLTCAVSQTWRDCSCR